MSEPGGHGEAGQFDDNPSGWAARWALEFAAARKALEPWHTVGDRIDKEFRNEVESKTTGDTRLAVFTSNVQTLMAMLYGQTPKVSVGRKFADAKDDVARVAGEMLERMLNCDIQRDSDSYSEALGNALADRLLPGMGNARVHYTRGKVEKTEGKPALLGADGVTVIAEAVPEVETSPNEDADTDYIHWKDQLWSPSRVFSEVQWWAFKNRMTREKLVKAFGEEVGQVIPLNGKRPDDDGAKDPWGRADVWEIWHKETKRVFWYVEGHPATLKDKPDPLGLDGFWPFPKPMFANLTTSKVVPRPDYAVHQDQYLQINVLVTRIQELTDAVRVAGLYDASNTDIPTLLTEAGRNRLIPVKNWNLAVEKGGLRGSVDWFPVEQVVAAIAVLQDRLSVTMDQLFQVTGWSDIMRGEATQAGATATEQHGKMKFGSVRIQRLQDEFARFASDIQKLRAQIIAKHFDAETIIARSNVMQTADADKLAPDGVTPLPQAGAELIKSGLAHYRIEVKPEAISLADFASMKQVRTEVLQALGGFFQVTAPMAQTIPGASPFLLQMAQWTVAGLPGASQIEGVFDEMIEAAQQAAQQPQQQAPDPKLLAQQMKGQQDQAKIQAEFQADAQLLQMEVQADAQREMNQRQQNVLEHAAKTQITAALKPPTPPGSGRPPQ